MPFQPQVWRDYHTNMQSVGDLWVGFLRFYLEEFDWKSMVVTVKQRKRLTKFEKMWTGKTIAVEGMVTCRRATWERLCVWGG